MKQRRSFFAPKSLKTGRKLYIKGLKMQGLIKASHESQMSYYHSISSIYSYSREDVKAALLKMSKGYCSICTLKLSEIAYHNSKSSIEHIKPKTSNPLKIYDWNNLLSVCLRCNNRRDDSPYTTQYLDPAKYDVNRILLVGLNGQIYTSNQKLLERTNYMIKIYKLNKDDIVLERLKFLNEVLNPSFNECFTNSIYEDEFKLFDNIYSQFGGIK